MGTTRGKGSMAMAAMLLISGGVAVGMVGSMLTSSAVAFRAPPRFPMTEPNVAMAAIDQASAGQAWARSAFPGGLRRCPEINAHFHAACEAEIKALSERPAMSYGSYGGPLLVTTIEPPETPDVEPDREEIGDAESQELQMASYEAVPPQDVVRHLPESAEDNYPALADHR